MPVPIPVLEEDAVQLVVETTLGGAEVDCHVARRLWVDIEAVDAPGLDRHLAVLRVDLAVLTVALDAHDARLDPEVLCLELVEVQQRALGPTGRLDQPTQVVGDRPVQLVLVRLTEEEASSWRRLEELCCENAAKSGMRQLVSIYKGTYFSIVSIHGRVRT